MADVTEVEAPLINVEGALTKVIQKITVVTTGDTWKTGLRSVVACGSNDPAGITKMAPVTDSGTITMTGTGTDVLAWAAGYP